MEIVLIKETTIDQGELVVVALRPVTCTDRRCTIGPISDTIRMFSRLLYTRDRMK